MMEKGKRPDVVSYNTSIMGLRNSGNETF
jgi:hypothetical protein